MILAHMMNVDRFALECDLAETYHIYDIKALPLSKIALFSAGLRHDSRIIMKLSNRKVSLEEELLASIVDNLKILVWFKTKDGHKGRNRPKSIVESLNGNDTKKKTQTFKTGEDFEKYRKELIKKYGKGGK